MATIGTFTKSENGFSGQIKTVTLNVKAKFAPAEKENDKAPDYRIFAGQTELGAAWKRTSNAGREYLSVKLDDPTFAAPIFASLVAVEGGDGCASALRLDGRGAYALDAVLRAAVLKSLPCLRPPLP